MVTAHIVVDYQNIHLTGHGAYCVEGEAKHLCLVHPVHFANQVLQQRNLMKRLVAERAGQGHTPATFGSVRSYRGQPSNKHDPSGYRRSQAQRSEWTRDPRSTVYYRTLKYYQRDGQVTDVKEKGIDVRVALELVTLAAQAKDDEVVILAAHDTDQEPALEMASRLKPGHVETAGWSGANQLRIPGAKLWHTRLDSDAFVRSRDRRQYT